MSTDYNPIVCYGYCFDWKEIKRLKKEGLFNGDLYGEYTDETGVNEDHKLFADSTDYNLVFGELLAYTDHDNADAIPFDVKDLGSKAELIQKVAGDLFNGGKPYPTPPVLFLTMLIK